MLIMIGSANFGTTNFCAAMHVKNDKVDHFSVQHMSQTFCRKSLQTGHVKR